MSWSRLRFSHQPNDGNLKFCMILRRRRLPEYHLLIEIKILRRRRLLENHLENKFSIAMSFRQCLICFFLNKCGGKKIKIKKRLVKNGPKDSYHPGGGSCRRPLASCAVANMVSTSRGSAKKIPLRISDSRPVVLIAILRQMRTRAAGERCEDKKGIRSSPPCLLALPKVPPENPI